MAVMINKFQRQIIDEQWHTHEISYLQEREISQWCFTQWGYPVGQLDPRTFDYNYRWHIERLGVQTSLVTRPTASYIAIKEDKDYTLFLLRWSSAV